MSVILSAASCMDWVAKLTGFSSVPAAFQALESHQGPFHSVTFLPYLSGERTPHNDPNAKGVFWGMTDETEAVDLVNAVLEGVTFALLDGLDAVRSVQSISDSIDVIGGGAKSAYWLQLLADVFAAPMDYRQGGDVGPSLGAARLAALGVQGMASINQVCFQPELIKCYEPRANMLGQFEEKRARFQSLYQGVKGLGQGVKG